MDLKIIEAMKHSPIHNYIVPGLTSWLIGQPSNHGCVRLFEMSREQQEFVTPHSHRFDFECVVLAGVVTNTKWIRSASGDPYIDRKIGKTQDFGRYNMELNGAVDRYSTYSNIYRAGDTYGMSANEIHTIHFGKHAKVLFFEGPMLKTGSTILEPYVGGVRVPTFKVEPWMFQKEKPCTT